MARLALIVNPSATRVTRRKAARVRDALEAEHVVEMTVTRRAGEARAMAEEARGRGVDAVVVLGGDGTLAETYPALVGGDVPLGVVPGGGTNVVARTLGISEDVGTAVRQLGASLLRTPRRLGLGRARYDHGDTLFGFCAGMGFDAASVALVQRRRRWKRLLGDVLYAASAIQAFAATDRRQPAIEVMPPEGLPVGPVYHVMVSNSSPYTFVGPRRMVVAPEAAFDRPLAVTAFGAMSLVFTLRMLGSTLGSGAALSADRRVTMLHDLDHVDAVATHPVHLQADGDARGLVQRVQFRYLPEVLPVLV